MWTTCVREMFNHELLEDIDYVLPSIVIKYFNVSAIQIHLLYFII